MRNVFLALSLAVLGSSCLPTGNVRAVCATPLGTFDKEGLTVEHLYGDVASLTDGKTTVVVSLINCTLWQTRK